jgi:hypothetical protein
MIIANIWKIFGLLLEYCSRSDFKATIRILEKEKSQAVFRLEQEIEKKNKLINEIEVKNTILR